MMYILPAVKDLHHLTLSFQLPSLEKQYRKKAEDYISHLVGHEGPGSLLSALKVGEPRGERQSCPIWKEPTQQVTGHKVEHSNNVWHGWKQTKKTAALSCAWTRS